MILCDTNILIEFYKGNPPIVARTFCEYGLIGQFWRSNPNFKAPSIGGLGA